MKVLELFAGSRSIGKACEELGYEVFSSDITPFDKIDYAIDILQFDVNNVPFVPDIIWASPPCTSYSVAGISHHRRDGKPISELAIQSDIIMIKLYDLIHHFINQNPKLIYYIENPRGMLRKMDFMDVYPIRQTITYCQYGDTRMKPTDIWTNNQNWNPRPMCKNGDTCHESAPRGSRTGTQGLKSDYNRSKIPHELCIEVLTKIDSYEL